MDLWPQKNPYFDHLDQVWLKLIGFYAVVTLWKGYLCLRTILRVKEMNAPPVLFDGKIDVLTFQMLKIRTNSEAYDKLLEAFVDLGIKISQVSSDYYPYVWNLTADFTDSPFYRAVWFSVIDRVLFESAFIPVTFFNAVYHRRDPFLAVLNGVYETLYTAGMTAIRELVVIYMFELIHPSGIAILMVLYEIAGMILLAVLMKFLENHILRPLPHNDVGLTIDYMSTSVGYPISKVYVDDMTAEPETMYYTALWFNMVTITPILMSVLDPNQITAVVAHELGKWYYFQNFYHNVCHFLCLFLRCYFLVATYGNQRICQIFRIDSNAHDVISHHLAFHFFWEPSYSFARGIYNIFKAFGYLIRDDYACRVWQPNSLREALIKLSHWNHLYFPLFDPWHAAWFYGSTTSIQRISRIRRKERPNDQRPPWGEHTG